MTQEIHVGDVGTAFTVTMMDGSLAVDLSTTTVLQIIFKKQDATTIERDAELVTDGADGQMRYVTVAGDLDMAGNWSLQGYIESATGKWHSTVQEFRVYANLA